MADDPAPLPPRPDLPPDPPVVRIARLFVLHDGHGPLPVRITAPLRRMVPEQWSTNLGTLMPVLVRAGVPVQGIQPQAMARWASLVHLVAILAGTAGTMAHAGGRPTGRVLFDIRFSEARLQKLLSARGAAMADSMARLARFLAANGGAPLDLGPLADLILYADRDGERAENARLRIAGDYYGAAAQTSSSLEATS